MNHLTGRENSDIINGKIVEDTPPEQLYNLKEDLPQKSDVYNRYPAKVEELSRALKEFVRGNKH